MEGVKAFVPPMSMNDLMTAICLFVTLCFGVSVLVFGSRSSHTSMQPQHATVTADSSGEHASVTKAPRTESSRKRGH